MRIETMVINSSSGIQGQHQRFKIIQEELVEHQNKCLLLLSTIIKASS